MTEITANSTTQERKAALKKERRAARKVQLAEQKAQQAAYEAREAAKTPLMKAQEELRLYTAALEYELSSYREKIERVALSLEQMAKRAREVESRVYYTEEKPLEGAEELLHDLHWGFANLNSEYLITSAASVLSAKKNVAEHAAIVTALEAENDIAEEKFQETAQ